MTKSHFQVELQAHNGVFGKQHPVSPFAGHILELDQCGLTEAVPPAGHIIRLGDRIFSYAYTVDFQTNGYRVYRQDKPRVPIAA